MKTILVDAYNSFVTEGGINLELKKHLDSFKNPKIILTNANEEEKIKYGIVNMPYKVFTLEHNPNKTNPEYYKIMLEHFNLKPENVIYFEHNSEAVNSAKRFGINTFHYIKSEGLEALMNFLKNNA
ncbi:HAD-IA family hydrolase [uncultured Planktosalinus sp.]|uniref:HAD-IA family hydrolase n=1 Tax=uncultured Planktosalinus sp. TaxID=1810935 RepID=UPI0030D9AE5B